MLGLCPNVYSAIDLSIVATYNSYFKFCTYQNLSQYPPHNQLQSSTPLNVLCPTFNHPNTSLRPLYYILKKTSWCTELPLDHKTTRADLSLKN